MTPYLMYTYNIIAGMKFLEDYINNDTYVMINNKKETIVFRNLDALDDAVIKELIKHQWATFTGSAWSSAECKVLVSK